MICSKDTLHSSKVSSILSSKEPQHFSTFASLRDNWEERTIISARKPILNNRQRTISFSKSVLSLVNNSANRKRGGDMDKGSAGKRYKGT